MAGKRGYWLKSLLAVFALVGFLTVLGCEDGSDTIIGGGAEESAAAYSIDHAKPGGNKTISLNGGNGGTGDGGSGGYVEGYCYGTGGIVFASGVKTVDTKFTVPKEEPTPDFGTIKLTVSSNLTLDVYLDTATGNASTNAGDCYLVLSDSSLYRNATPSVDVVTGLEIEQGATLTLGLNMNWSGGGTGEDSCYIYFDEDIVINGTVTVKDLTTGTVAGNPIDQRHTAAAITADKGHLNLECGYNVFMSSTGVIDTSGDDAIVMNARGGDGGGVYIYGSSAVFIHGNIYANGGDGLGTGIGGNGGTHGDWIEGIYFYTDDGMLVSTGDIMDVSGGDGSDGGDAGYIELDGYTFLYNTADLIANGGNGSNGDGGYVNGIYLYSYYASLFNSGDMESNGGNATNGDAGSGGYVDIEANVAGAWWASYRITQLFNSGDITVNGGNVTSGSGDGGSANNINLYNYGSGDVRNTGEISGNGGNAGSGAGNSGGNGSYLEFYAYKGYDDWYGNYSNKGDILCTGNISLNGGNGDNGGQGGDLYLDNQYYNGDYDMPDYGIYFVGYSDVYANGGSGANGGGDIWWNYLYLYTYSASGVAGVDYTECGPIIFMADFYANGGDGTNGNGGDSGYVEMVTDGDAFLGNTACIFNGDISINGGDGSTGGGDNGDYVYLYGYDYTEFVGDIRACGGDATAGNNDGGDGNNSGIDIISTYDVYISGNIYGWGGDAAGTGDGGDASNDTVEIYAGGQVICNVDFELQGGDATTGTGGDSGYIDIFSDWFATKWTGTTWDISAGAGTPAGSKGEVMIDWVYYER